MCGPHHIFRVWLCLTQEASAQLVREKDDAKDCNDLAYHDDVDVGVDEYLDFDIMLTLMLMLVIMRQSWVDDTMIL